MDGKGDISKVFLEIFFRELISKIAAKGNLNQRKEIDEIKSKINIYESRNNVFSENEKMSAPRPPINKQIIGVANSEEVLMVNAFEDKDTFMPSIIPKAPAPFPPQVMPVRPAPPILPQRPMKPKPMKIQRLMPKRKEAPIANPSKPVSIQNNSPVKGEFTPSIGISVVNEELTGVPSIDKILQDEEVKTIECPGPNKQVLVYKGGKIQAANLTLTADEINNIMANFSKRARIPIGNGFFKAAIDKYLITSVMSEFVGTRFIIQRKSQAPDVQLR